MYYPTAYGSKTPEHYLGSHAAQTGTDPALHVLAVFSFFLLRTNHLSSLFAFFFRLSLSTLEQPSTDASTSAAM